jgi:hypothetical protein
MQFLVFLIGVNTLILCAIFNTIIDIRGILKRGRERL